MHGADGVAVKPAGDQLWQVSLLEAQMRSLVSDPSTFFQGYFYYGMDNALFGSDLLLGLLLIFFPVQLVAGNADLSFNITWHVAFWLNPALMYFAAYSLTRNHWAALTAGTIFGFGAIQINYAHAHFQYAGAWWIPLTIFFSIRFVRSLSWKEFAGAVLSVWLQFVTVPMLAYMAGFVLFVFAVIPTLWWSLKTRNWRVPMQMLIVSTAITAVFVPVVMGYLEFSNDWNAERDITEVQNGSLQLRDYLSPSSRLHWYEWLQHRFSVPTGERRVFPGFVPLFVGISALILAGKDIARRERTHWHTIGALTLLIGSVILSLGPYWKTNETVTAIELPYLFLFENFPAFKAIRVTARFAVLANVALAILAAVAVQGMIRRLGDRSRIAGLLSLGVTAAVLLESFTYPVNIHKVPQDPELEVLLATTPPGPTIFVPVSGADEIRRLWFATRAGSGPLINGYSGFIWPQYWHFRNATAEVTNSNVSRLARGLSAHGIRNIVLERTRLVSEQLAAWETLDGTPEIDTIIDSGKWTLFQLAPSTLSATSTWTDIETRMILKSAPPDAGLLTWLTLANKRSDPWIPPNGSHVRNALVRWHNSDGDLVLEFETNLLPPPFLIEANSHSLIIHLFTPAEPGQYSVTLEADGSTIVSQNVQVTTSQLASFAGTVEGLEARLNIVSTQTFNGWPGEKFLLHVNALNTGEITWGGEGNIRLGWRWYRVLPNGEEIVTTYEDRLPLLGHLTGPIRPGNGYSFRGLVTTPPEPGVFKLRVSMVAETFGWFDALPAVVDVNLTRGKRSDQ